MSKVWYATQMPNKNLATLNRYKNVDDVLPDLDFDSLSLQAASSLSSSQASITSLPYSESETPLNQTPIDLNCESVKLKIQATHLVAEFVEARREFINAYENWLINRKLIILELYQLCEELDKWKFGKDVSQAAGSGLGIIGGAVGLTGALTVLTGGAALPAGLIFAGIGVGLTGGVTSLSGNIMETIADKKKARQAIEHLADDETRTAKVVQCYENLKLTMFEAKFVLDRHETCKQIIHSKLNALDVPTETFNPHGLIHTMKVEQLKTTEYGQQVHYNVQTDKGLSTRVRSASDAVEELDNEQAKFHSADTRNSSVRIATSETTNKHADVTQAADSQDISRGASALATSVSGSNTVKDVVGIVMKNGLQSAQSLAVGLGSAFIVVDLYQIFNASMSLTKGSISDTAKVLRQKGDQLLEQQLFFNQIYEYLR